MARKLTWTLIDPDFHGFQYLTEDDIIFYHLEYYTSYGFSHSNNSFVLNYKKDIKFKGTNHWHYKNEAINDYANLIINTGSHFIVWRDLIKQKHPSVKVRGFYLARAINV